MTELDTFLLNSWGKCHAYGVHIESDVSRVCPLARSVHSLLRNPGIPPSFRCGDYERKSCPLQSKVEEQALTLSYERETNPTAEEIVSLMPDSNREAREYVAWWLSTGSLVSIRKMIIEVLELKELCFNEARRPRSDERRYWHDSQLSLWEMLEYKRS